MHVYTARRSIDSAPWHDLAGWPVFDLAMPPHQSSAASEAVDAAERAVLLSVIGADCRAAGLARLAAEREAAVIPHLREVVILRTGPVVEDLSIYVDGLRTYGAAAHAYGEDPIAWVAAADIAAAAVVAVAAPHADPVRAFDLAGSGLATIGSLLAEIVDPEQASAWSVSPAELERELASTGASAKTVREIALYQSWASGFTESSEQQLRRILGRDPSDLVEALRAASDDGAVCAPGSHHKEATRS